MGAGDLLLRGDLQTDRFNLVSAEEAWRLLTSPSTAAGLGFGWLASRGRGGISAGFSLGTRGAGWL